MDEQPQTVHVRPGPVTWSELTASLVWPMILRSAVLALHPPRMLLALGMIVLLGASAHAYDWLLTAVNRDAIVVPTLTQISDQLDGFTGAVLSANMPEAVSALYGAFYAVPIDALGHRPAGLGVFALVVFVPLWTIFGGALSRMVALDFAGQMDIPIAAGLRFAARRAPAFIGALLAPLAIMAAFALILSILGWIGLVIPGVRVVGAALYGILLIIGFLLALLYVAFVLGQALLVPAVACDGADSMDAVQRSFAYVFARPGRTVLYIAIAAVQGVIALALARWLLTSTIALTSDLATGWLPSASSSALTDPGATDPSTARQLITGWEDIALLLLPAFFVSFYFTASTLTYLGLRRSCDEQDVRDIWMPGLVEGSQVPQTPPADTNAPEPQSSAT